MGGMDYWTGAAPGMTASKSKRTPASSAPMVPGTPGTPLMAPNRDGVPGDQLWMQVPELSASLVYYESIVMMVPVPPHGLPLLE